MIYTNKHNLPGPLVAALAHQAEKHQLAPGADVSVTQLVSPHRLRRLRECHHNEIVEDVTDRAWALWGSIVHDLVARMDQTDALVEETLTETSVVREGMVTVSGRPDIYTSDGHLWDVKGCSTWAVADGIKEVWVAQLNLYAHMARGLGFPVQRLSIIAFLRDHSTRKARTDPSYPQAGILPYDVPLWTDEQATDYLLRRCREFLDYRFSAPNDAPVCTPYERWEKPTVWAVMKPGGKRAVKRHGLFTDAVDHAAALTKTGVDARIVERPGECTRCLYHCPVAQWCDHGRQVLMAGAEQKEETSDAE